MLSGPAARFDQNDHFDAPPSGKGMPNQWHGRFTSAEKSMGAEFVMLMRIGSDCGGEPSAIATRAPDGWRVQVDRTTVAFAGKQVSVDAAPVTAALSATRARR
jgi:hypothetical protein